MAVALHRDLHGLLAFLVAEVPLTSKVVLEIWQAGVPLPGSALPFRFGSFWHLGDVMLAVAAVPKHVPQQFFGFRFCETGNFLGVLDVVKVDADELPGPVQAAQVKLVSCIRGSHPKLVAETFAVLHGNGLDPFGPFPGLIEDERDSPDRASGLIKPSVTLQPLLLCPVFRGDSAPCVIIWNFLFVIFCNHATIYL